jgi:cell division protein FtsW
MQRTLREVIGTFEGADRWLLISTGLLLFLGVFEVYGAGSYNRQGLNSPLGEHFIVFKHLLMIGLGGALLLVLSHIDYHVWRHPWINRGALGGTYMLVALTLVVGRHDSAGNDEINRWVGIGGFSIQPVEMAKLALVMFMAERLAAGRGGVRNTGRPLLMTLAAGPLLLMMMLALQPNYGNVMVVAGVTVLMLFVTATADRYLRWVLLGAPVVGVLAYVTVPKILHRVNQQFSGLQGGSFGHQVDQSLIGLGAGGPGGLGVGQSHNKFSFLPEAHTDFIYSVLGEEMGLAGSLGVIVLLMVFVWRGLVIAQRAPDPFGRALASGLTGGLAIYGITNLAMVTGLFPVVGVPLPFVSFGGTAMLASLASIGLLLSIDRASQSYQICKRRWTRGGGVA